MPDWIDDIVEDLNSLQTQSVVLFLWGSQVPVEFLRPGGNSLLYKATHPSLHDVRFIKQYRTTTRSLDAVLEVERKERFLREARVGTKLKHDHLVRVDDYFPDSHQPCFTMRYEPDSRSFREGWAKRDFLEDLGLFAKTTLSGYQEFARRFAGILDAIALAHSREIWHHDITPSNILIDANGKLLVIDWGMATFRESGVLSGDNRFTAVSGYVPDWVRGTLDEPVKSPKEIKCDRTRTQFDLFQVGVTMCEVLWDDFLSTCLPCDLRGTSRNKITEVNNTQFHARAEFIKQQKHCPVDFQKILLRLLAGPFGGYGSAGDARDDLLRFANGVRLLLSPWWHEPIYWLRRGRNQWLLVATFVLIVAFSGFVYFGTGWSTERKIRQDQTRFFAVTVRYGDRVDAIEAGRKDLDLSASRDVHRLGTEGFEFPAVPLCNHMLDSLSAARLRELRSPSGEAISCMDISADGFRLAVGHDSGLILIWNPTSDSNNPLHRLEWSGSEGPSSLSLSRDGSRLAVRDRPGMTVVFDLTTNPPTEIFHETSVIGHKVALRPDGREIALTGPDLAITLMPLSSPRAQRIKLPNTAFAEEFAGRSPLLMFGGIAYSPQGRYLAVASQAGLCIWDLKVPDREGRFWRSKRFFSGNSAPTFLSENELLAAGEGGKTAVICNIDKLEIGSSFDLPHERFHRLSMVRGSNEFIMGAARSGTATVVRRSDGAVVWRGDGLNPAPIEIAVNPRRPEAYLAANDAVSMVSLQPSEMSPLNQLPRFDVVNRNWSLSCDGQWMAYEQASSKIVLRSLGNNLNELKYTVSPAYGTVIGLQCDASSRWVTVVAWKDAAEPSGVRSGRLVVLQFPFGGDPASMEVRLDEELSLAPLGDNVNFSPKAYFAVDQRLAAVVNLRTADDFVLVDLRSAQPELKFVSTRTHSSAGPLLADTAAPPSIRKVVFSPDKNTIYVHKDTPGLCRVSLIHSEPERIFSMHSGAASTFALSPEGEILLVADQTGLHRVDAKTMRSLGPPIAVRGAISSLTIPEKPNVFVTGNTKGLLQVWDASFDLPLLEIDTTAQADLLPVTSLEFLTSNSTALALELDERELIVWSFGSRKVLPAVREELLNASKAGLQEQSPPADAVDRDALMTELDHVKNASDQ